MFIIKDKNVDHGHKTKSCCHWFGLANSLGTRGERKLDEFAGGEELQCFTRIRW